MTTTLNEETRRARKAHGCNVCRGRIAAGDRYRVQTNVGGGDLWTWRAHLLCYAAFGLAWDIDWHDFDNNPDWWEIAPLILRFFAVLAGSDEP